MTEKKKEASEEKKEEPKKKASEEKKEEPKKKASEEKKEEPKKKASEEKKEEPKKKASEEKKEEPKVYTIPLGDAFNVPRKKRVKKALFVLSEYFKKHLRSDEVRISKSLNEALWERGIEKPPRKIRVKVSDEEGVYTAEAL